jgi:hypothetical protein
MILSPTDAPDNATASLGKMMMAEQVSGGTQSTSLPADDDLEDGFFGLLNKLDSVKSTNVWFENLLIPSSLNQKSYDWNLITTVFE